MAAVRCTGLALALARVLGLSRASAATVAGGAAADVRAGEAVYGRCMACHALAYDRTGPHHCGLFGRRAGSVAGFPYSEAMKRSEIVWSARTLDRFLANPVKTVPGTTMGYAGVTDKRERAALIAYLREATRCPDQDKHK
jgi:cytochrome c